MGRGFGWGRVVDEDANARGTGRCCEAVTMRSGLVAWGMSV